MLLLLGIFLCGLPHHLALHPENGNYPLFPFFSLLLIPKLDFHSLLTVFNSLKLQTHDLSLSSLTNKLKISNERLQANRKSYLRSVAVAAGEESETSAATTGYETEEELYLLCTQSDQSLLIQKKLIQMQSEDEKKNEKKIHTVHTSKSEKTICYLTLMTEPLMMTISQDPGVKSCTVIPHELKIHESLMFFLGLVDRSHSAYSELSHRYSGRLTQLDLSQVKLVVSGNLGVPHKDRSSRDDITHQMTTLRTGLSSSPSSHLQRLSSLHTSFFTSSSLSAEEELQSLPNIWSRSATILEKEEATAAATTDITAKEKLLLGPSSSRHTDLCSFSALSLTHTGHSVVVGNLQAIQQSTQPTACFASLLALLVTSRTVSDVRMRFPKRMSNNYIKGIIQKNAREQDYPYAAVGLDGTGQVVGIGTSLLLHAL
jgi:hypothetical protein